MDIYSNCATLAVGCFVYTNSAKTIPVSNGYISLYPTCYTIINSTGYISAISSCPTPTVTPTVTPTPGPATINWSNYEYPSPYVDSDLYINGSLYAGGAASGTFTVSPNTSITVEQKSNTSSGYNAEYSLSVYNNTDGVFVYDQTYLGVVSFYQTVLSHTFTALSSKTYTITATNTPFPL
jgi:hypothetical protein